MASPIKGSAASPLAVLSSPAARKVCRRCGRDTSIHPRCPATGEMHSEQKLSLKKDKFVRATTQAYMDEQVRLWALKACARIDTDLVSPGEQENRAFMMSLEEHERHMTMKQFETDMEMVKLYEAKNEEHRKAKRTRAADRKAAKKKSMDIACKPWTQADEDTCYESDSDMSDADGRNNEQNDNGGAGGGGVKAIRSLKSGDTAGVSGNTSSTPAAKSGTQPQHHVQTSQDSTNPNLSRHDTTDIRMLARAVKTPAHGHSAELPRGVCRRCGKNEAETKRCVATGELHALMPGTATAESILGRPALPPPGKAHFGKAARDARMKKKKEGVIPAPMATWEMMSQPSDAVLFRDRKGTAQGKKQLPPLGILAPALTDEEERVQIEQARQDIEAERIRKEKQQNRERSHRGDGDENNDISGGSPHRVMSPSAPTPIPRDENGNVDYRALALQQHQERLAAETAARRRANATADENDDENENAGQSSDSDESVDEHGVPLNPSVRPLSKKAEEKRLLRRERLAAARVASSVVPLESNHRLRIEEEWAMSWSKMAAECHTMTSSVVGPRVHLELDEADDREVIEAEQDIAITELKSVGLSIAEGKVQHARNMAQLERMTAEAADANPDTHHENDHARDDDEEAPQGRDANDEADAELDIRHDDGGISPESTHNGRRGCSPLSHNDSSAQIAHENDNGQGVSPSRSDRPPSHGGTSSTGASPAVSPTTRRQLSQESIASSVARRSMSASERRAQRAAGRAASAGRAEERQKQRNFAQETMQLEDDERHMRATILAEWFDAEREAHNAAYRLSKAATEDSKVTQEILSAAEDLEQDMITVQEEEQQVRFKAERYVAWYQNRMFRGSILDEEQHSWLRIMRLMFQDEELADREDVMAEQSLEWEFEIRTAWVAQPPPGLPPLRTTTSDTQEKAAREEKTQRSQAEREAEARTEAMVESRTADAKAQDRFVAEEARSQASS